MRLTSIKLSGFKSFAESTTFLLPGDLVGVVGPNGCGKSNIMDAVRWVLGESRAGELRGASMQDVIFNGTTARKPAGRASVELAFDNADGQGGGAWGRYAEIVVRRVITRTGTSTYYINSQAVRRRDVQDVFLGTGLGPRAYAIIGQGTIGRIIEAKPEDLRSFLEEAAGVSKYKDRRRETQNRLAGARDNLARVNDLLRELEGSLRKLERQAQVAERYRTLRADRAACQARLWYRSHADAERERAAAHQRAQENASALEARRAQLEEAGADVERQRAEHEEATQAMNRAQGALYEAAAELARLTTQARFEEEKRRSAAERLREIDAQIGRWTQQRDRAQAGLQELAASATDREAQLESLQETRARAADAVSRCAQALDAARRDEQALRDTRAALQQRIGVLRAECALLAKQSQQLDARAARSAEELRGLPAVDDAALARQREDAAGAAQRTQACVDALAEHERATQQCRQAHQVRRDAFARTERERAEVAARLAALRSLQQRLETDGHLAPWLARHGLDIGAAFWHRTRVAKGWEQAVEAVLRERAAALQVDDLAQATALVGAKPPASVSFHVMARAEPDAGAPAPALQPLIDVVETRDAGLRGVLAEWLHGCYAADTLEAALGARSLLAAGEWLVVPEGHRVGRHGVDLYQPVGAQAGFLLRAREIEDLAEQAAACDAACVAAAEARDRAQAAEAEAVRHLAAARGALERARQYQRDAEARASRAERDAELARQRRAQLESAAAELQQERAHLAQRQTELAKALDALAPEQERAEADAAAGQSRRGAAEAALNQARAAQNAAQNRLQEARFARQQSAARQAELERGSQAAREQLGTLAIERRRCEQDVVPDAGVALAGQVEVAAARKQESEQRLAACRERADAAARSLRRADERRMSLERDLEPLRERAAQLQLEEQAARLNRERFAEELRSAGVDIARLEAEGLDHVQGADDLRQTIARLDASIAACGAVNLAALDELTTLRERKALLDGQSADLVEATTTLEEAIRRIDRETRDLLAQTFGAVNEHFGRLFPELFGGGHAELVLTGDEILDAGVQVMATPPGKRNQSIHVLSGGEKALTAIALVFAIFELNPAPFCLLDEVDAPLDDANTERYAALVKKMSRRGTQFLFISHNRIAMEQAEQLIGVTMAEQGVSRIVSVDLEQALGWAESDADATATAGA